jgi:hypothetical protein
MQQTNPSNIRCLIYIAITMVVLTVVTTITAGYAMPLAVEAMQTLNSISH